MPSARSRLAYNTAVHHAVAVQSSGWRPPRGGGKDRVGETKRRPVSRGPGFYRGSDRRLARRPRQRVAGSGTAVSPDALPAVRTRAGRRGARAGRRDLPDSQPNALATRRPAPAMLQPPSTPPQPTPTTASAAAPESFDAVRHRWPERSQPSAQACWDAPTIQALRQYSVTAYPRSRFAAASTERLDSVNTPSAPRSSSNSWSRPPAPISAYERWPLCYSAPPLARPRTPSRELSTTAIQPHGKNASNSPPPAHVVEAMIS